MILWPSVSGFSCATLEAHASYTVPLITDADCLGGIYKDSGCIMTNSPIRDNLDEYSLKMIEVLKNKTLQDDIINKCREFSKNYTWKIVAKKMEQIIIEGKKNK